MHVCLCVYVCVATIKEIESMNLRKSKGEYMGRIDGMKEKGKSNIYILILKNKKIHFVCGAKI